MKSQEIFENLLDGVMEALLSNNSDEKNQILRTAYKRVIDKDMEHKKEVLERLAQYSISLNEKYPTVKQGI